jgi:hypothetical protein
MDSEKTIIEINGVKLEVDLRHAKRVDTFQVGTQVKVLEKATTYNAAKVHSGVIVGFEPFEAMPTIVVCYLEIGYNAADLKFAYINPTKESREKWELVASVDDDLPVKKQDVLSKMDREIEAKRTEIAEIERKRVYFLHHFGRYFANATIAE